jgi:hypothetical protein
MLTTWLTLAGYTLALIALGTVAIWFAAGGSNDTH